MFQHQGFRNRLETTNVRSRTSYNAEHAFAGFCPSVKADQHYSGWRHRWSSSTPLAASRRTAWTRFSCSADHGTQGGRAKLCEQVCPVCIIRTMFLQPCNPHAFHMDDCLHAGHVHARKARQRAWRRTPPRQCAFGHGSRCKLSTPKLELRSVLTPGLWGGQ